MELRSGGGVVKLEGRLVPGREMDLKSFGEWVELFAEEVSPGRRMAEVVKSWESRGCLREDAALVEARAREVACVGLTVEQWELCLARMRAVVRGGGGGADVEDERRRMLEAERSRIEETNRRIAADKAETDALKERLRDEIARLEAERAEVTELKGRLNDERLRLEAKRAHVVELKAGLESAIEHLGS